MEVLEILNLLRNRLVEIQVYRNIVKRRHDRGIYTPFRTH